jgi:hypothetical protein
MNSTALECQLLLFPAAVYPLDDEADRPRLKATSRGFERLSISPGRAAHSRPP